MSKQLISSATEYFVGDFKDPIAIATNAKSGVPVTFWSQVYLGTPGVGVSDWLVKAATSTELPNAGTKTYTPATDNTSPLDGAAPAPSTIFANGTSQLAWVLDAPRALTGVMTHSSSVVASTVLISGFDWFMQPMSELMTFTATGTTKTVAGKKAFAYITSVAIYSASDSTANTLNLGTNEVLGLPYTLTKKADFVNSGCYFNDTVESTAPTVVKADATSPATTSTGDTRGTVDLNSTLDGSAIYVMYRIDKSNPRGIAQV